MELSKVFGQRMEQRRVELDLKFKDVKARMVTTSPSQSAIHNWEGGKRVPRMEYIDEIALALETTPAWLFGFTDEQDGVIKSNSLYANMPPLTITPPGREEVVIPSDTTLRVTEAELAKRNLEPSQLCWVRSTDNSMGERIGDGDLVLVDRSIVIPAQTDIFAMLVNDRIWFRWIRPEIDGSYTVFAENDSKSPLTQAPTEIPGNRLPSLCILGRVAGVMHFR
ncbi:LexA family transcriptional regulator [Pseudomonas putida]|uniref:XRE family transcriptional regulator n=1 Tax=Pseudomonas putida TaxID=303 RepID=UPI0018E68566|nr:LexA family transcriptional regulator [Pseudomonas putida]MBI6944231.1 LexA family transcriptional regulator [Pseudomonas putida]MBI6960332.1 LexA family transcriptional regulator [Pseudomonas putida]